MVNHGVEYQPGVFIAVGNASFDFLYVSGAEMGSKSGVSRNAFFQLFFSESA